MTVRVGVIGCGYWGPNLVRNLLEIGGCEIVACADRREERRAFMRRRFPSLDVHDSAESLIDDGSVDAVVVATPLQTHVPLTERALLAGKHVLVEKPLATGEADAQHLADLADRRDRRLMVGHTFLFSGAVQKIRDLTLSGLLGRIYYFESQRVNLGIFRADTNVLWDLGPHDVSIMLDCIDREPASVLAVAAPHLPGSYENTAYVTMKFEDGMVGFLHLSWLSPVKFRRLVIAGSERMVVYDDAEPSEKVRIYEHGVSVVDEDDSEHSSETPPVMGRQYVYRSGDVSIPRLDTREPLLGECEEFIRSIEQNRCPRSDARFAVRVVRVLEAMQRSLVAGGSEIRIEPSRGPAPA
ncbi:MAG: Gfo/Idh/MocA family protein [Dehalococcoidia bacterium]